MIGLVKKRIELATLESSFAEPRGDNLSGSALYQRQLDALARTLVTIDRSQLSVMFDALYRAAGADSTAAKRALEILAERSRGAGAPTMALLYGLRETIEARVGTAEVRSAYGEALLALAEHADHSRTSTLGSPSC